MSKTTAKIKLNSFAKEVVARLAGDNNEVLAQKISRKSLSAIQGQVAALKAAKVDAELALENAQEALDDATYPTDYNSNSKSYCDNLVQAQSVVDSRQDDLDDISDSIEFFEGLIGKFTDGDA